MKQDDENEGKGAFWIATITFAILVVGVISLIVWIL